MLSIVAPVYNEEASLPELIRRCLAVGAQMGKEFGEKFELILVNDGSADQSSRLIAEAADAHPDVVIGVLLARNGGQHAAHGNSRLDCGVLPDGGGGQRGGAGGHDGLDRQL